MRVNLLPDFQLETLLKQLKADFEEIKTRQITSGASGVLAYTTMTDDTWDFTETIGNPADYPSTSHTVNVKITFTSLVQNYPVANLFVDLFVLDNSSNLLRIDNGRQVYDNGSTGRISITTGGLSYYRPTLLADQKTLLESTNQLVWNFSFTYTGQVTYYLKAYAIGSDRGTLTFVKTVL